MTAGAEDFLPKPFDDEELLKAVAQALNKSQREQNERTEVAEIRKRLSSVTPREREVLCHVVAGQRNKQIAAGLSIAEKTIKVHRARVMEKWRQFACRVGSDDSANWYSHAAVSR
jgi:FixJ family two-component response regulator